MDATYTPFDLLVDVGSISALMLVGNFLRRKIRIFQTLLIPASITAGLIGMILGPEVLGWIPFSEQVGDYSTLLVAAVFAAMPYSMVFDQRVRTGAKAMWAYSSGMFLGQWGLFIVLGLLLFVPIWGTENWFGMVLPIGFVGGFGTAAAVGGALSGTGVPGAEVASSLGFTSATVGTLVAIVGGIAFARWGLKNEKGVSIGGKLTRDMLSGYIDKEEERPSIGKATTNPSAIEPLSLHAGVVALTVLVAYIVNSVVADHFPVSIPLFAMSFVIGVLGRLILTATKMTIIDRDTMNAVSGAATDYLIAFGIASIVPAAVAAYWVPLTVMFVLGTIYCCFFFFWVAPHFFGPKFLERAIFGWGWATAAVATGIALLKIVDPKLKSGTLSEYGVAYVAYVPFELGMTIIAPIAVLAGFVPALGWAALVLALGILIGAFLFGWRKQHEVPAEPAG